VAIFCGAATGLLAPGLLATDPELPTALFGTGLGPVAVGSLVMFAVGLVDDVRSLRARTKFLLQVAVAAGLCLAGVRLGALSIGEGFSVALPPTLDVALTMLWFVGITNAFNLIDGHDGVAGGVALLALATISYAAVVNGNEAVAFVALALSGAVLGFLLFNLPPASVFMGDAGSLFVGFSLAGLGLVAVRGGPNDAVPFMVPVLALGVPVLDTSLAIVRRFLRGDSFFRPDRGHIHHRLHDLGYPRTVVTLLMWGLAGIFSLVAVMLLTRDPLLTAIGLTLAVTASLIAIRWLEAPEIAELGRAVQRAFVQRSTIRQNVRLRDAVELLNESETPEDLHGALQHAFRDSLCAHIELWVPGDWEPVLAPHGAFASDSFGMVWRAGDHDAGDAWEIVVALELSTPRAGRLSLRYGTEGSDSTDNVESIVRKVRPALCHTLDRLLARGEDQTEKQPPAVERTKGGSDSRRGRS
jgi:UDP-GlcNAc:undecaprenyl-phosphate GlcNAc-1-phosphate transferase